MEMAVAAAVVKLVDLISLQGAMRAA
jgi:hypothetical protein